MICLNCLNWEISCPMGVRPNTNFSFQAANSSPAHNRAKQGTRAETGSKQAPHHPGHFCAKSPRYDVLVVAIVRRLRMSTMCDMAGCDHSLTRLTTVPCVRHEALSCTLVVCETAEHNKKQTCKFPASLCARARWHSAFVQEALRIVCLFLRVLFVCCCFCYLDAMTEPDVYVNE